MHLVTDRPPMALPRRKFSWVHHRTLKRQLNARHALVCKAVRVIFSMGLNAGPKARRFWNKNQLLATRNMAEHIHQTWLSPTNCSGFYGGSAILWEPLATTTTAMMTVSFLQLWFHWSSFHVYSLFRLKISAFTNNAGALILLLFHAIQYWLNIHSFLLSFLM